MVDLQFSVAATGVTAFPQDIPAGTTLYNTDSAHAVWLGTSPAIAPGIGLRVNPYGSVTTQSDGPVYGCVDTNVTAPVVLSTSTALGNLNDPVGIGAAIAVRLLNQTQQVQVQGGNVGVSGAVTSYGTNTWSTIWNYGTVNVAGGTSGYNYTNFVLDADMRGQQSLLLKVGIYNGDSRGLVAGFRVIWYDSPGNSLGEVNLIEYLPYWCFGGCYIITPVKGQFLRIDIFNDVSLYGNYGYSCSPYVASSSLDIPEFYATYPGSQPGALVSSQNVTQIYQGNTDMAAGPIMLNAGFTYNNGSILWNIPCFARQMNGSFGYSVPPGGNVGLRIYQYVPNAQLQNQEPSAISSPQWAPIWDIYYTNTGSAAVYATQQFTFNACKAPMAVSLSSYMPNGYGSRLWVNFGPERF